jgi:tetratricopeptide (TPR) repeat protein
MNFLKLSIIVASGAVGLTGCATSKVALFSNPPQAKIFARSLHDGREQFVGETPLKVSAREIEVANGGTGPVTISFRKDGYETKDVVLSEVGVDDLMLSAELTPQNGLADQQTINFVIESMFECQRLVRIKRYDEALRLLERLQAMAPQVASIYELKGGVYYLTRNYRDALDNYALAVKYNPKNAETLRMVGLLKNLAPSDDRAPAESSK